MNILRDLAVDCPPPEEMPEEKLRDLRDFSEMLASYLNHEFAGSMNIIVGYSTMVLEEWSGSLNEDQRQSLTQVVTAARGAAARLVRIVDACRTVIRDSPPAPVSVDVTALVRDVCASFRPEAAAKGVAVEIGGDTCDSVTDRERLAFCLRTVIGNAVRYTEKGKVTVTVSTGEEDAEVRVEDTGPGFSEAEGAKLFRSFVRLSYPVSRGIEGTGVSLYLTRRFLTRYLGGDISCAGTPGKGSIFTIRFARFPLPGYECR